MSIAPTPESSDSGVRARFRHWRRTRPFWGGVIAIAGGFELYGLTRAPLSFAVMQGLPGLATFTITALTIILSIVTWRQPHLRSVTGWVIIVMGVISILVSNLGGFLIGMILLVVGGSMIVAWQPLVYEDVYDEDGDYDDSEYEEDYADEYEEYEEYEEDTTQADGDADRSTVHAEADPSGDPGRRRTGGGRIILDVIRRHGLAGVKGFVRGNRPGRRRPAEKDRRRQRTRGPAGVLGPSRAHSPSLRSIASLVVPPLLLALGGQFVIAGPASAATGQTCTSTAPDWWPVDWDPFPSDCTTTPAKPATPVPAAPAPATPAQPPQQLPADPLAPQLPDLDIPGVPLPAETPDAGTPDEKKAAEEAAQAAADKACDLKNYPDQLPALGSTLAKQAAAVLNNCITAQVRADNVPTPVTPAEGGKTTSADLSVMKASQLEMNGFAYNGVRTLPTATGKVRVLAFSADLVTVKGYDHTYGLAAVGEKRLRDPGTVKISGHVKLFVTSMSGKAFGLIPLTFTPDSPPPLVVPYLLFTDTVTNVALVSADTITLPELTVSVTL